MDGLSELAFGGISFLLAKLLLDSEHNRQKSVKKLQDQKVWEVEELKQHLEQNKPSPKTISEEIAAYGKSYLINARITSAEQVKLTSAFGKDITVGKKLSSSSPVSQEASIAVVSR